LLELQKAIGCAPVPIMEWHARTRSRLEHRQTKAFCALLAIARDGILKLLAATDVNSPFIHPNN
jgi:hypothetical protein